MQAIANACTSEIVKLIQDAQGNILGYENCYGTQWKRVSFDAYGPIVPDIEDALESLDCRIPIEEAVAKAHTWRGKRTDATGLIWMGSRYYDAGVGRFISPDPYGHEGSIDLYSYANGNPVVYCDPDGRFFSAVYEGSRNHIDHIQTSLDVAGMVPVLGAAPDMLNAAIHGARGNWVQAGISMVAAVPLYGDIIGGANLVGKAGNGMRKWDRGGKHSIKSFSQQISLPIPSGYNQWTGEIKSVVAQTDTVMYRIWGDEANRIGSWLSPSKPLSTVSSMRSLALPPGNSAEYFSKVLVPAGTRYQIGTAASAFGQPGRGMQVLLLDRVPLSNFGPATKLAPMKKL